MTPASPASMPENAMAATMLRLTLTPMYFAHLRFCPTAFSSKPKVVRSKMNCTANAMRTAMTMPSGTLQFTPAICTPVQVRRAWGEQMRLVRVSIST